MLLPFRAVSLVINEGMNESLSIKRLLLLSVLLLLLLLLLPFLPFLLLLLLFRIKAWYGPFPIKCRLPSEALVAMLLCFNEPRNHSRTVTLGVRPKGLDFQMRFWSNMLHVCPMCFWTKDSVPTKILVALRFSSTSSL